MSYLSSSRALKPARSIPFSLLMVAACAWPGWCSSPALEVSPGGTEGSGVAAVGFAQISTSSPEVALSVESAHVKIRRVPAQQDIVVLSNCPKHWNVTGGVIRQVALSTTQKGVQLRADAAGAHVVVNGRVYQLPRDSDGAIRSLKVENGVVLINGRALEPLPGSDKPGSCTGPDALEVTVPDQYSGGLTIYCRGRSTVAVDSWKGGNLVASLSGEAALSAGKVSGLKKAVVDVQGTGTAQIDGLWAKAFVANINGGGSVKVNSGVADMSNATVSGTGSIELTGQFRNLKKSVQGTGSVTVTE